MATTTTKLARAKVDRVTQVKNELAFRKGDLVEVLDKNPGKSGMWQGRVYSNAGSTKKMCKDSDKGGLFPSSYVIQLSIDETNRIVASNGGSISGPATHSSFLSKSSHKTSFLSSTHSPAKTPTSSVSSATHKRSMTSFGGSSADKPLSPSSPSSVSHTRSMSSSKASSISPSRVTSTTSMLSPSSSSSSTSSSPMKPVRNTVSTSTMETKKRGTIIVDNESPFCIDNDLKWKEIVPITVSITVGETKAKYSGLKKFTTYEIKIINDRRNSRKIEPVERRYKHFVWLHQRLCEEFPLLVLPSLPEKQIAGRFDDQVVEYRRRHLEIYLNYCTHHPIIGESQVLMFFIENPGEVTEWKAGKRAAEKEAKETGDLFLQRVKILSDAPMKKVGPTIEAFKKYTSAHQKALLSVYEAESALNEKVTGLSPEYGRVAERLSQLCEEKCWDDECKLCTGMHKRYANYAECCKAEMEDLKMESRISFLADISQHYGMLIGTFSQLEKSVETAGEKSEKLKAVMVAEMKSLHEKQGADIYQALISTAEQELAHHKKMVEKWEKYIQESNGYA